MKEETKISWRMYGFVPYNISEIQKGIQFGHAVVEYGLKHHKDDDYKDWAEYHKTFIILNGGTSTTMRQNAITLNEERIKNACFVEPDLNDMLSAVVFLVDSRVYDRENYLDFYDYCVRIKGRNDLPSKKEFGSDLSELTRTAKEMGTSDYNDWVEYMGGEKNIFLREYLTNFRLA
jgi:hypothetical protein